MSVEVLSEACEAEPDWDWARYQLARERWRSVGLTVAAAVDYLCTLIDHTPSFVQVGANDGRRVDPIHKLVRERGIRGLLVEPQPEPFEKLKANYADIDGLRFERAAITEEDGPIEMVTTDRSTIGSLMPDRNKLSLRSDGEVQKITVEGLTFDTALAKHNIEHFDLLQIDTEGFDYRVLRQVDLDARRVSIVNLEYNCLLVSERVAVCQQLEAAGFAWSFSDMDLLAVKRDAFEEAFCLTEVDRRVEGPIWGSR